MQFIALANGADYSETRAVLSEPWEKVDVTALLALARTPEDVARERLKATASVRDRDIEKFVDFYNSVLVCRDSGLCDEHLIDEFFRNEIPGFYCSYEERLRLIAGRLNRPDYAAKLKRYAGSCGG